MDDNPLEVSLCLPQLVEACKYETPPLSSNLKRIILKVALGNIAHASFLNWYLVVAMMELPTDDMKQRHQRAMMRQLFEFFQQALAQQAAQHPDLTLNYKQRIEDQERFVTGLKEVYERIKEGAKERREEKVRAMRNMLEHGPYSFLRALHRSLYLPLDPDVIVTGIVPSEVGIFKSAMAPFRLPLLRVDENNNSLGTYTIIYKNGDDMRQDQLVMQIIELIDRLWKQDGLDLQLTKYKVLPTGADSGMVECVPDCEALQKIMDNYGGSIAKYLAEKNPLPQDTVQPQQRSSTIEKYDIPADVVRTFIRSTAGYSVISYILGIGDRHLDNLLLRQDGHLFHIDFGFIFGRDPKPLPPAMKIRPEMVEVMGGMNSDGYKQFKTLCCTAFCKLRKNATMIINLVNLMRDANIPDMKNPDKAISFLLDRFHLKMEDEKVWQHMQDLITRSETALFPLWLDYLHEKAQRFR
eukprot:c4854_g1_i1.p1 GENE.c4854_g1_i1~~c4854_g1_i1.p1  ORF type:complete len:467 (+),score=131.15 c4854_g1_i1:1451-2851(+)